MFVQAKKYLQGLRGNKGKKAGEAASSSDHAARERLEQAARALAELKYLLLLERIPSIVYTQAIGSAGRCLFISNRVQSILGFSPAEWMKDPNLWYRQVHPEDRERVVEEEHRCAKAGHPLRTEYRIFKRGGQMIWVADSAVPVKDPDSDSILLHGTMTDVTERKSLEEALRKSESRLTAILNAQRVCVKLVNSSGALEYMNPAGLAMLEADSLGQVEGHCMVDIVEPPYRLEFQELTKKVFRGGSGTLEFEIVGLKGSRRWLETHAVPLRNADGGIEHLLAVTRDVTEQKTALKALQASEIRFRALIENSNDAIALITREGKIVYASPASAKVLGYQPGEMVDLSVSEIVHPEDLPLVQGKMEEVMRQPGRVQAVIARGRHKDGTWRVAEGTFTNLLDNQDVQAIVANYRDATERILAEDALRSSEERFETAFRSSPLPISISTHAEGKYLDVNEAFLKMMGYEREQVIGRTSEELEVWEKPDGRRLALGQLSESGRVVALQTKLKTSRGERRTVEISAEMIALGNVPCVLAITKDVTESKSLERQLQQAQKMEAVGQLAGGVAHDFNNLVMVINGCAELIKESATENPKIGRFADQILNAGNKAASLTRQLLAFSRKQPQELKVFDLNTVISDFCKMLPSFIGEDIEMIVAPQGAPSMIHSDATQVEQVIMNLVVNARDAMPKGGRLTVETSNIELDSDYALQHGVKAQPGKYVMLSISDTGIGMDAETQARIFEPFFTTKEPGKGTGLGLATVYGIVKQNKGYLWVYSEVEQGTTFKVYLPLASSSQKNEELVPSAEATSLVGSETILLVEDRESLRNIVAEYLSSRGYKVLAAEQGAAALQICETYKQQIHVLLSDVVMPGMTGPEFVREALRTHQEARVIFMSGYPDRALESADLKMKSVTVQKPLKLHALVQTIRAVLDQKREDSISS